MRGQEARHWLEQYLYEAPECQATEDSIFEDGGRAGFSQYALRQAARAVGVVIVAGFWELPADRIEGLDVRAILEFDRQSQAPALPPLPAVISIDPGAVRPRRAE